jgi:hypothetical protein
MSANRSYCNPQLSSRNQRISSQKRNSSVSPTSAEECVFAVQMANRAGMEAINRNVLDGRANLSVTAAGEGYVIAASQAITSDLQR